MGIFDFFKIKQKKQPKAKSKLSQPYENYTIFPLFNKIVEIVKEEGVTREYVERCVDHLETLSDEVITKLCQASLIYCEENRESFFENDIYIPKKLPDRTILKYITPLILTIDKPIDDRIGYRFECDCLWDKEERLEFTILEDEILYVGKVHEESPWQDPNKLKEKPWNYLNKIKK